MSIRVSTLENIECVDSKNLYLHPLLQPFGTRNKKYATQHFLNVARRFFLHELRFFDAALGKNGHVTFAGKHEPKTEIRLAKRS